MAGSGGDDYAIWRRVKLLPFSVTIPENERDPHLAERLQSELSGILNWAIQGCLKWQESGLKEPQIVTDATAGYRSEQDMIRCWMNDDCTVEPGADAGASALYTSYKSWCSENEIKFPLSQRGLGLKLSDLGFERITKDGRKRYRGIRIVAEY